MSDTRPEGDLPSIAPPPDLAAMRANIDRVFGELLQNDPSKFCRWVVAVILEKPSPENPLHDYWSTEDDRMPRLIHLRKRYRFLAGVVLDSLDKPGREEQQGVYSLRAAIEGEMRGFLDVKYLHLRLPAMEFWSFDSLCWKFFEWARDPLDWALSRAAEWVAQGVPLFTKGADGSLSVIYDDDPRVVFLAESSKLGGLYPVNEPPAWMSEVFVRREDMKIHQWLFNFDKTPSDDEIAERRIALRKQIEIPNMNLKNASSKIDISETKRGSTKPLAGTVLQMMLENDFPITDLHDAARNGLMSEYIAKLILNGDQIVQRSTESWEYKSLAHWAEESFIMSEGTSWMWERGGLTISKSWPEEAQKKFADWCFVNSIYEEEEGLVFYVKEKQGDFRPAKAGDPAYDFLCRLRADGGVQGMGFIKPPSWAEELFLNRHNYDVYRMFWHSLDGEEYSVAKKFKRDAVLRETLRQSGQARFNSPSKADVVAQANFERGLAKLRILPRPLSFQMVSVVDLANQVVTRAGISLEEALGHIWQTTVHDESYFLYELGRGLPNDIGPAALNTAFIDRTCLNDPKEDLAWLQQYAFTPADAQEILDALPARSSLATEVSGVGSDEHGYLDPLHPRYAPKLAAAVKAWQAVQETGKRTPKQAMEKWLNEHAAELRIADQEGKPVKQAVEEISKVANWNLAGGAPKMPESLG